MNERVRHKLSEIVQRYGRDICREPRRCKGLLLDHCAGDRREVFVLVSALEEQVVGDLLQGLGGQSWGMVSSRLVRRLVENRAMAEDAALWAVESWALALGLVSGAELVAKRPARQSHGTKNSPATTAPSAQGESVQAVSGRIPPNAPAVVTSRAGQIRLKLIPPGEFWMGSPESDSEASDDEKPRHAVRISQAFYLGEAPVTQAQYKAISGTNPSRFRGSPGDRPVETVTFYEAMAFCNELSRRGGLKPFYKIWGSRWVIGGYDGYRLPTEAEWEYACRAGTESLYCFGDGLAALGGYAWYSANSQARTSPVRQKLANAIGLYDMHGNVWEWCWDTYDRAYYKRSPDVDPLNTEGGAYRVVRGGSWNDQPADVRAGARYKTSPEAGAEFVGFRVAQGMPGWK